MKDVKVLSARSWGLARSWKGKEPGQLIATGRRGAL